MRPGQQAPESPRFRPGRLRQRRRCFNEARAASPGIPSGAGDGYLECTEASMRPGQQAPESQLASTPTHSPINSFNEARAASPGIPDGADPVFDRA